jgi:hypothetical protein
MAVYYIICKEIEIVADPKSHHHVTTVGTKQGGKPALMWTVEEVRKAIARGDQFLTERDQALPETKVECVACPVCNKKQTLQSTTQAMNDLDHQPELGRCR